MFPPKCRLTFNGLDGVISQKRELLITTAVRTSIPRTKLHFVNTVLPQFRAWKHKVS
jgi:hypothetical protein